MECRCYHGGEGRTRLKVLKCHARDLVVSLAVIAFGVGLVLLNAVKFGYVMK